MFKAIFFIMVLLSAPILIIGALFDIMKSEFGGNNKVAWVLIVLFLPLIGSLLYMAIGKSQKI